MVMKKKGPLVVREGSRGGDAGDADVGASFSREIAAGDFKARCLALMDEVRDRGGEYVITKRGAAVAKLVPIRQKRRRLLGSMKGTVTMRGDIIGPLGEPWEALAGWDDEP
jgi:prevent-host-death family protein